MNKEEFDGKKRQVICILKQINQCTHSIVIESFIIDLDSIDYSNTNSVPVNILKDV